MQSIAPGFRFGVEVKIQKNKAPTYRQISSLSDAVAHYAEEGSISSAAQVEERKFGGSVQYLNMVTGELILRGEKYLIQH